MSRLCTRDAGALRNGTIIVTGGRHLPDATSKSFR
jgi:hypothetical protein